MINSDLIIHPAMKNHELMLSLSIVIVYMFDPLSQLLFYRLKDPKSKESYYPILTALNKVLKTNTETCYFYFHATLLRSPSQSA